jgi:acyl-CoA thioesterase
MTTEEARLFFQKDKFATETTGIVIENVLENYSKCSLKICEKHMNAANSVMGGAIFTLADFSFAVASNTKDSLTVTASSTINYLGPAKGDSLISECTLIKDGKRVCYYEINICDNLGNKIALIT